MITIKAFFVALAGLWAGWRLRRLIYGCDQCDRAGYSTLRRENDTIAQFLRDYTRARGGEDSLMEEERFALRYASPTEAWRSYQSRRGEDEFRKVD